MDTQSKKMLHNLITTYGYTAAQLAEKLGVSKKTIHRIMKGAKPCIKNEINLITFYWRRVLNKIT